MKLFLESPGLNQRIWIPRTWNHPDQAWHIHTAQYRALYQGKQLRVRQYSTDKNVKQNVWATFEAILIRHAKLISLKFTFILFLLPSLNHLNAQTCFKSLLQSDFSSILQRSKANNAPVPLQQGEILEYQQKSPWAPWSPSPPGEMTAKQRSPFVLEKQFWEPSRVTAKKTLYPVYTQIYLVFFI